MTAVFRVAKASLTREREIRGASAFFAEDEEACCVLAKLPMEEFLEEFAWAELASSLR
jgi:hypothetical protein